jgi:hypothetical protein
MGSNPFDFSDMPIPSDEELEKLGKHARDSGDSMKGANDPTPDEEKELEGLFGGRPPQGKPIPEITGEDFEKHAKQYASSSRKTPDWPRLRDLARRSSESAPVDDDPLKGFGDDADVQLPVIDDGADIQVAEIVAPPLIIDGILHRGLKMVIAGASKSMKSWMSLQIALCVATGHEFLGRNVTKAGAFFLNLEVPKWHFDSRVQIMAEQLDVTLERGMFKSWSLRGVDLSGDVTWNSATAQIAQINDLGIIIIDPLYKLCNERRNENDQGAMTALMKRFDLLAEQTGASTNFNHHYAKGSPNSKDAIDRFSGSGVIVRDPDVYIAMTRHAEDNAFVLELTLRCLPQIEPFAVRWNYPLFELARDLDPEQLRKPAGKPFEKQYTVDILVKVLGDKALKTGVFKNAVMTETGMSSATFYRFKNEAEEKKLIAYDGQTETWERCGKR